jgi:hypothetical protein
MRYAIALLVLVVAGCGKSQAGVPAPVMSEKASAAADKILSVARQKRDLMAELSVSPAANDADKRDLKRHVREFDVWIRDFERAQDAKDEGAVYRRIAEFQVLWEKTRKRDLVGGVR